MKIVIEGNIGCGKSSLLTAISQRTRLPIFLEPVDTDWKQGLELFYSDHSRWGFTFNLTVLNTYSQWTNNSFKGIYERSPISCREVFTKLQYESGKMTEYEFKLYNDFFQKMSWVPDVVIYVKTDPEVCLQRMQSRGRHCEDGVPIEYLRGVHDKHELMISNSDYKNKTVIHVVDGNRDKEAVYAEVMSIINNL
jgi:deoxyadenosine/deoxycytidine kinase